MLKASVIKDLSNVDWARCEFEHTVLADQRLSKRLIRIADDFARRPAASIPKACVDAASVKAAYRFFEHDEVSEHQLLAGHRQRTLERLRQEPIVLAIQDTTSLDYATHEHTEGLGPTTNDTAGSGRGMFLHTTMACTPAKLPLGLIHTRMWARDPARYGDNIKRNSKPLEEKESYKWLESFQATDQLTRALPATKVVNVADREGDVYEVFAAALESAKVAVLIRAQHNRQIVSTSQLLLWEHMAAHPVAATLTIDIPRHNGAPARQARCQIRFGAAPLQAPLLKKQQPSLHNVWFIEVREVDTPPSAKAILWRLLTTLPVTTLEEAMEKVGWYLVRWQIEVFHRTLKTGCAVEALQLDHVDKLKRAVALKMVVAWRIMLLAYCSRDQSDLPASVLLTTEEIAVLQTMARTNPSTDSLTLRQAVRAMAGLGGFLGRKRDGEPGVITLWRGMQRLMDMTAAVLAFKKCG